MGRKNRPGETPSDVLERRTRVARLMATMDHPTLDAITERLGVPRTTVYRDMVWVKEQWKEDRLQAIDDFIARELKKIDLVEYEAWKAVAQSQQDQVVVRQVIRSVPVKKGKKTETVERVIEEVRNVVPGRTDTTALNTILRCQERRSRLLGLDAVHREDDTSGDVNTFIFTLKVGEKKVIVNDDDDRLPDGPVLDIPPEDVKVVRLDHDGKRLPETTQKDNGSNSEDTLEG